MAGRGDNNKQGSSGRGAGHQSTQGMDQQTQGKPGSKKQTGGTRSQPQKGSRDQSAHRNTGVDSDQG